VTIVDPENELARVFGYRAIPNGFAFGPDGRLIGSKIPSFDIREAASRELLESWLGPTRETPRPPDEAAAAEPATEAIDLFAQGSRLMREGRKMDALAAWARAFEKDPKNFVIRKQIWRALYPERFGETLDLAWQKEQIARENAEGFAAANPDLPADAGLPR